MSDSDVKYPIHPLDLTSLSDPITLGGQKYTACVAAFHGIDEWAPGEFDISLGDSFLRNVYASFDFGNDPATGTQGTPYVQLYSQLDVEKAKAQVNTIRAQTLQGRPPVIDPDQILQYLGSDGTNTEGGKKKLFGGSSGGASSSSSDGNAAGLRMSEDSATFSLSAEALKKWGLIALSLLGANVVIGLVLIGFALCACIKKGKSMRRSNTLAPSAPHYVPVPLNNNNNNKEMHYDDGTYQGYQDNSYKAYDPQPPYSTH